MFLILLFLNQWTFEVTTSLSSIDVEAFKTHLFCVFFRSLIIYLSSQLSLVILFIKDNEVKYLQFL